MMRFLTIITCLFIYTACSDESPAKDTVADTSATSQEHTPAYTDVSPIEFADLMGQANAVVIDVRTPAEIAKGKIEGAREINYRASNFEEQIKQLDPDKTYLIYCAVGGRSGRTCQKLVEFGFEKVYNLRGGFDAWSQNY